MVWVIGYEGTRGEDAPLSWGAAALSTVNIVSNAATGLGRPRTEEELQELAAHGAITLLPKGSHVQFRALKEDARPVVLEVTPATSAALKFEETSKHFATKCVGQSSDGAESVFFIFRERQKFDVVRLQVASDVCRRALYELGDRSERLQHLTLGLALSAHHDTLNALWAFFSEGDESLLFRRAEARVRPEESKVRFRKFYHVLKHVHENYVISYSDNSQDLLPETDAAGGGMDVDKLAPIVTALGTMHKRIDERAIEDFPCLDPAPASRLYTVDAASAVLTFRSDVKGRPLGEQVARYLELELMQKILAGEAQLPPERALDAAVQAIAVPDDETEVKHGIIDAPAKDEPERIQLIKEQLAAVAPLKEIQEVTRKTERYSAPMTLLGYQSGSINDWHIIQVSIGPGVRLTMSPTKDHLGRKPEGIDTVFGKRETYARPALFTVVRERRPSGTIKFHLSRVALIGTKSAVNAVPSGMVSTGFVFVSFEVGLAPRNKARVDIEGNGVTLSIPSDTTDISSAFAWMRDYAKICAGVELKDLRLRRLAPLIMPPSSELVRALWALAKAEAPSSAEVLRKIVRDGLGPDRQVWGFGRLARTHSDYISATDGLFGITPAGQRYLDAFRLFDRKAAVRALPD